MCQLIVTNLACGHKIRGPLLQCPAASRTAPRGPPHDDGRMVLCPRSEALSLHQSTCCETCFAIIFRGFLGAVCQPCRRVVIPRMGQELVDMLQRASVHDAGPGDMESSNGDLNQARQVAEEAHRMAEDARKKAEEARKKAEEICKKAEQALMTAEASCKRATAECQKATAECTEATRCRNVGDFRASKKQDASNSSSGCHWPDS